MKHFEHPLKHKPSELLWRMMLAFSVFLFVCGLVLSPWDTLLPGLAAIHRSPDVLISDYFIIGGMGATMLNAGLVTLASLLLTRRLGLTYSGLSVAAILIMGGFALFGKNLVNCLPILFGNWLFARYQEEKWNKYIVIGLFSTCLAPFVSFLYNALSTALWLPRLESAWSSALWCLPWRRIPPPSTWVTTSSMWALPLDLWPLR